MKEFLGNVKQELDKITWPTGKEMKLHSMQVFVFMVILSLFFAVVDGIISAGVATATRDNAVVEEGDYDEYDLDDLLDDDENVDDDNGDDDTDEDDDNGEDED